MAVEAQQQTGQPRSGGRRFATARARRVFFGTNVAVMILAAIVLLVFVNWIAARRHIRRDLASMGAYGLSERTKKIIDQCPGPVSYTHLTLPTN